MTKLILLLQWSHAVEVGAYQAYEGHWRAIPSKFSKKVNTIKSIQADELEHKLAIEDMLLRLHTKPNWLMDAFVWTIGKTISVSCRFMGLRMANYGAAIMELMGANLYQKVAKVARNEGYPFMASELYYFHLVEKHHERLIKYL